MIINIFSNICYSNNIILYFIICLFLSHAHEYRAINRIEFPEREIEYSARTQLVEWSGRCEKLQWNRNSVSPGVHQEQDRTPPLGDLGAHCGQGLDACVNEEANGDHY